MSNYPILRVPSSIKSANSAIPPVPVSLSSPPKEPKGTPGDKPKRIEWSGVFKTHIVVSLFCSFAASFGNPYFLILFLLLILSVSFKIYGQFQDYPERFKRWEIKKKDFDYLQSEYQRQKEQYEQKSSQSFTQSQIKEYRKKEILKALVQTSPHDGNGSQARKGRSEKKFEQNLKKHFPGKVYTDLTLTRPGFDYPYSPDFTYIDSDTNLYIDIEIDEPYVFDTGEPTHFKECQKDKRRNEFFLAKNWIVIRFTEGQICEYPEECCKFIAAIALRCGIPIPTTLKNVANLPIISQWTEVEARKMAANKTRDKYSVKK